MANSFTDLAADAYVAVDVVAREKTGFVGGVTINGSGAQEAAVGQVVRSAFTEPATANDITPSMTIPEGDDQTVNNKTLTLTRQKAVQIPYTGEDTRFLNGGAGYRTVLGYQIQQAMRTLVNAVDTDLATEAYQNASRAVGVAGTTPFASNTNVLASALRVLEDNGAPDDGMMQAVFGPAAIENLRTLDKLRDVDTSGTDDLLRRGSIGNLYDMAIRQSKHVVAHTKGQGTGYLTAAAVAAGATAVTADTGSGTLLAGDVLTFAADANNKYVASSALAGGAFSLAEPGAIVSIADNNAITIGDSYTGNVAFHRNAIELAMRAPAVPEGGDAAEEMEIIQDPISGLTFALCMYKGYKKAMIEVSAVWGYKAWMPKYITTIMG